MTPEELYPGLKILRFEIEISTQQDIPPDFYLGSTWRGILGWELKRLLCPYPRPPDCPGCILRDNCPYFVLFEQKTDLPGILDAPRGYILYPPLNSKDKKISLEITLIGHCTRFVAAVLQALAKAQKRGLGKDRIPFSIISMAENTPEKIQHLDIRKDILAQIRGPFTLNQWLEHLQDNGPVYNFRLPTPLRLRQKGRYLSDMDLSFTFTTLARRLEALSCIFDRASPLGKKRWLEVCALFQGLDKPGNSDSVRTGKDGFFRDLHWDDFARFSRRQKRKVPMGGLVGECTLVSDLPGLGRWLKCAELLHVGKGAAMGLGRIERTEDG